MVYGMHDDSMDVLEREHKDLLEQIEICTRVLFSVFKYIFSCFPIIQG